MGFGRFSSQCGATMYREFAVIVREERISNKKGPSYEGPFKDCYWSGRRDSNSRLPPWQGGALPLSHFRSILRPVSKPVPRFDGAEGQTRTVDTGIFSAVLYHLSYLGRGSIIKSTHIHCQEAFPSSCLVLPCWPTGSLPNLSHIPKTTA